MSDLLKINIKKTENSGGPDDFTLESIKRDQDVLFDDDSLTIDLGSGSYEFEMEVYLDGVYKHTILVSQAESNETIKPGGDLPSNTSFTQAESNETIKPSKDLPNETSLGGNSLKLPDN